MRTTLLIAHTFALCAGLVASSSPQETPTSPLALPPNPRLAQPIPGSLVWEERHAFWLVEAQCTGFRPSIKDRHLLVPIATVIHNFTGPKEIIGQTFIPTGPIYSFYPPPLPLPMAQGSKGLFVVMLFKDRGPLIDRGGGYGFFLPVLDKGGSTPTSSLSQFPTYADALAYARSIEQLSQSPRAEQIRLLSGYARSSTPWLSDWAVSTLAKSGEESMTPFLLGLANTPTLPIDSQLTLDKELRVLDNAGKVKWSGTSAQLNLWQRLVSSPQDRDNGISIVNGLLNIEREEGRALKNAQPQAYTPALDGTRLFKWLQMAGANGGWPPESRAFAIASVGNLYILGLMSRDSVWTYLLPLLQSHPDFSESKPSFSAETRALNAALAEGALAAMKDLRPFAPTEEATLRSLLAKAKADRLKRLFDYTLAKNG